MNYTTVIAFLSIMTINTVLLPSPVMSEENMTSALSIQNADGASAYQERFKELGFFVGTIGDVTVDTVTLQGNRLVIKYVYSQGQEIRHVTSELERVAPNLYKGHCTTISSGKVVFKVNTWIEFNEDGTAQGHWSWTGDPTSEDAVVMISKRE